MAIVACACVAIVMIPELVPRLNQLIATINNRVKIWTFAVEQIKEAPIFGRGFFSYRFLYREMVATRPELYKAALCHNLLFESMLSFGIAGTGLIGIYFITFFKTILKNHDELKRRGHNYVVTTFIAALSVAITFYGMIDTTVIWVQTGMIILMVFSGIGVDERELRHLRHTEQSRSTQEEP
jgi:O-antigen ligase